MIRCAALTGSNGAFGWDVIAGFYFVRAEAPGCVDPADPTRAFVDTPILAVETEWTGLQLGLECAPIITAPDDITVPTTDPAGAIVTFQVSAADAVEGPVPAACNPLSGSLFSLGTTIVECSAEDSFGHDAFALFTVTVQADIAVPGDTIRAVIQSVRVELAGLGKDNDRIEKAIDKLDKALADDLWIDADTLTEQGKKALKEIERAVKELTKLDDEIVSGAIERLERQTERLATDAVAAAIAGAGDADEVAKALGELAKAEAHLVEGEVDKAIGHYRKAWEKAAKSLS